jgi:hypothetical protein
MTGNGTSHSPGPPPRAVTPTVLRRSILEPRVRFWWIAGVILLVAMCDFLVSEFLNWRQEARIVSDGVPIIATITAMGDGSLRGTVSPDNPVRMAFTYNGQDYSVAGWLEGRQESISIQQPVPIKIDPNDPNQWTYRTQIPPIAHALVEPGLMAPFTAAALTASVLLRRRILRTWTNGVAEEFVVETVGGPTALAPASRAVRFRSMNGRDQRLICISIPQRLATMKPGDVQWLIHPPGKPAAALAAVVYEN